MISIRGILCTLKYSKSAIPTLTNSGVEGNITLTESTWEETRKQCVATLCTPVAWYLFIAIRSRAGHTNNWHSIALTGSSAPWSTRRLDIERTSTPFTLLEVEVIAVLASLTLLSVQPRHPSKESKTKQELAHFTKIQRSSSVEPDDHYPLTCTPENGVWMLNTCRFFAFAWKRSKELESYDVLWR